MIENTSKTLLSLISRLISKNVITRQSLSKYQSIQAHMVKIYNQMALRLAVCSYHEVLRWTKGLHCKGIETKC